LHALVKQEKGHVWQQQQHHLHVALSQGLVDGQQAGDLLDDHLPRQLDGPAAVVAALALGLEPPGFLADGREGGRSQGGRRQGRGRRETADSAPPEEVPGHHLIKSGFCNPNNLRCPFVHG